MPRFEQDPDPVFWQLNASLSFDRRLAPYDVRQSRAHARALRAAGILDDGELEELLAGLDRVEAELEASEFPVAEDFSRRSLALPFHPGETEAVVERVVGALADVHGRRSGSGPGRS